MTVLERLKMPKPKDVYILIEQIELAEGNGSFFATCVDKEILNQMKAKADSGINLTDSQWERAVSLYLRSQGRNVSE